MMNNGALFAENDRMHDAPGHVLTSGVDRRLKESPVGLRQLRTEYRTPDNDLRVFCSSCG